MKVYQRGRWVTGPAVEDEHAAAASMTRRDSQMFVVTTDGAVYAFGQRRSGLPRHVKGLPGAPDNVQATPAPVAALPTRDARGALLDWHTTTPDDASRFEYRHGPDTWPH